MKRRKFIKNSLASASLPFWLQHCDFKAQGDNYPIFIANDASTGHQLFASNEWKTKIIDKVDTLIVGGGIAGVTAAYQLRNSSFALYELSATLGGSSASKNYEGIRFSQGAHYELEYPDRYGEDVLKLLEELNIITYQPWRKQWAFKDTQHYIPPFRRQQCFDHGVSRAEVLPPGPLTNDFIALMKSFTSSMIMPTRQIDPTYHYLNDLTFTDFLQRELPGVEAILPYIDYHMKDDWGGDCRSVSALAGVHYFACRPYYDKHVALFSPPEGNDYFVQKMRTKLPDHQIHTQALVSEIVQDGLEYTTTILNLATKERWIQKSNQVIYAGQKHALKYVMPGQEKLFAHAQAPWMIVNLITSQSEKTYGYWQNEYLGKNESFLGFIDSSVQDQESLAVKRIFTCYYCLKPENRQYLADVAQHQSTIVQETVSYVEEMLGTSLDVQSAHIKVMGHAMPIPVPGYLLRDANDQAEAVLLYAGVDNGRLPLLYEAIDSGIEAVKRIS